MGEGLLLSLPGMKHPDSKLSVAERVSRGSTFKSLAHRVLILPETSSLLATAHWAENEEGRPCDVTMSIESNPRKTEQLGGQNHAWGQSSEFGPGAVGDHESTFE